MQFPSVSRRGDEGCQEFSDIYYGRLLGVIKKDNKLLLKHGG